jgi:hypothetical protein
MSYANQQGRLSPQQQKFVDAILKGSSITKAYEKAGYKPHRQNASRAMANERVQSAIAAARAEAAKRTGHTVETLVRDLDEIRILAIQDQQYAAAAACVMGQGKLLGLMIDRKEIDVLHRPAPISTATIELTEDQWREQFAAPKLIEAQAVVDDFME